MKIQINGEERSVGDGLTVDALVREMEMKADRVAIELNHKILPRTEWAEARLREGDRLEVVHFVGGG